MKREDYQFYRRQPQRFAELVPQLDQLLIDLQTGKKQPTRVVVTADGYATSAEHALRDYGVVPTRAFVRRDGWVLSAPEHLADVAQSLWADQWYAVYIPLPTVGPVPSPN